MSENLKEEFTNKMLSKNWDIDDTIASWKFNGFTPTPPLLDSTPGSTVRQNGREYVNLASISFFGMNGRQDVLSKFCESAQQFGLATAGSRMVQGKMRPHVELESRIAQATSKESAMTFASGLLANYGFINAMSGSIEIGEGVSWDQDDTVFVLDRDCHWSLWKAVEPLKFGRRVFAFPHNDMKRLEKLLKTLQDKRVIVVFESVYSADGSFAPIADIIEISQRYNALTYIDDANGFLVYGEEDSPFHDEYAAAAEATFHMVSLSKAVGAEGGAIAGPKAYIEAFEWFSGTSSFTAQIQPPTASAAVAAMDLIQHDRSIVHRFHDRSNYFRESLEAAGFRLSSTPTYIISVHIGSEIIAERVRNGASELGYLVPVFRYPAVKKGQAGLRLMPHVDHTDDQIDGFVEALCQMRKVHPF